MTEIDARSIRARDHSPDHTLRAYPAPQGPGGVLPPERRADALFDDMEEDTLLRSQRALDTRHAQLVIELAERDAEIALLRSAQQGDIGPEFTIQARARAGGSRWWVAVIGAVLGLGGGATGAETDRYLHRLLDEPVTRPQLQNVSDDLKIQRESLTAHVDAQLKTDKLNERRLKILAAFECSQGLRADNLDCDALQKFTDFEAQPLTSKKLPLWKTRREWSSEE